MFIGVRKARKKQFPLAKLLPSAFFCYLRRANISLMKTQPDEIFSVESAASETCPHHVRLTTLWPLTLNF